MNAGRAQQRKNLKKERNDLLKKLNISRSSFNRKMPRVNKRGKDFELVNLADGLGKKPSLIQQVIWLRESVRLYEETKQQVEEMLEAAKVQQEKEEVEVLPEIKEPTFKQI